MVIIPPAKSNAERQRQFRASHPGYFSRYKSAYRAEMKRLRLAAAEAAAARETSPPSNPAPATTTSSDGDLAPSTLLGSAADD